MPDYERVGGGIVNVYRKKESIWPTIVGVAVFILVVWALAS